MISIKNSGEHRVQVFRENKCIKDTGFFKNLILDRFFTRMTSPATTNFFNSSTSSQMCSVGSGTVPAANDDAFLGSIIATKIGADSKLGSYIGRSDGFFKYSMERIFSFPVGAVIGNVSEIGTIIDLSSPTTSEPLDTRAVLPSTITVTDQDQLVITHTRFIYVPDTDQVGSITLGGINYDYTIRVANAADSDVISFVSNPYYWSVRGQTGSNYGRFLFSDGDLPVIAGDTWAGGSGISASENPSVIEVDSGNILIGRFNTVYAPNQGNIAGGIKIITYLGDSIVQNYFFGCKFVPNIPKTSSERLTLNLQINHSRI